MAQPDDGWLEVISLGSAPRLQFAVSTLAIYRGTHVNGPDVAVHRARRVQVDLTNESVREGFPLDIDGEPLGTLPIDIELVPNAISFCIP